MAKNRYYHGLVLDHFGGTYFHNYKGEARSPFSELVK